jgi:hypothetical protein
LIFISLVQAVIASSITVKPDMLDFGNIDRGSYNKLDLTITSDSSTPVKIDAKLAGIPEGWVYVLNLSNHYFSSRTAINAKVIIAPPKDSDAKAYEGKLTLLFSVEQPNLILAAPEEFYDIPVKFAAAETVVEQNDLKDLLEEEDSVIALNISVATIFLLGLTGIIFLNIVLRKRLYKK